MTNIFKTNMPDIEDDKLKNKIREYWNDVKTTLPEKVIDDFTNLLEIELHKYSPGIGLCLCGSIIKPDSEVYSLFLENGINNKEEIIYQIIREWHREANENKIISLNDELKKTILGLWAGIRKSVFKENDTLAEFINTQVSELCFYHFGLGTYLRNTFLYPNDELRQQFVENGINQPDDMSSAMIQIWHSALRDGTIK